MAARLCASIQRFWRWVILLYSYNPGAHWLFIIISRTEGGAVAEWVRASTGDQTVDGSSPTSVKIFSFRNFGNSVHPALPVSFGWDSKSRWSLLSGVYARGSKKKSHQSAPECVTVVDSTSRSKPPRSASMRLKKLPCTDKGRRRRRKVWCVESIDGTWVAV